MTYLSDVELECAHIVAQATKAYATKFGIEPNFHCLMLTVRGWQMNVSGVTIKHDPDVTGRAPTLDGVLPAFLKALADFNPLDSIAAKAGMTADQLRALAAKEAA